MHTSSIRNFVILAHIDHGKSTLADRFLELTKTVSRDKLQPQFLDRLSVERERGITVKMQPVRMIYRTHRRITRNDTQNNAEGFLHGDLTYKIRGALFQVRKKIGLGHKEQIYHNALEIELKNEGLKFESKKNIPILYDGKNIGVYQPDFVVENKVLIELKALPEIGRTQTEQLLSYLKGCEYKIALLANFGSNDLEIKRVIYDTSRQFQRLSASHQRDSAQVEEYILNLIDTPGHYDFSFEVSRALNAVEGAILLVDVTQGVQAQTLANFELAQKENLTIIPVLNKIDLARNNKEIIEERRKEITNLTSGYPKAVREIYNVSGKTGEGVEGLLEAVVSSIPPPRLFHDTKDFSALIFDSHFDSYKGVIAHVRAFSGAAVKEQPLFLIASQEQFKPLEVGFFSPELKPQDNIREGEIGYLATGIKEPGRISIGERIGSKKELAKEIQNILTETPQPQPLVFSSFFPASADTSAGRSVRPAGGTEKDGDFLQLRKALERLHLNDPAFTFAPVHSEIFSRGFEVGCRGLLHLQIVKERLEQEFNAKIIITLPSVEYTLHMKNGQTATIHGAHQMPGMETIEKILEPVIELELLIPEKDLSPVMQILRNSRSRNENVTTFSHGRLLVLAEVPLADFISGFTDAFKNVTSGYGSLSYRFLGFFEGNLVRLDVLLNHQIAAGLSFIVPQGSKDKFARTMAEKIKNILPRENFSVPIQIAEGSKIIARETIPALKKDVTGYLYGGDRSRKMKLWKKQKAGKKKLQAQGKVTLTADTYIKLIGGAA